MADRGIAGARLSKLGRYEVLSELGKGAMGVVYLAKDPVIGRMVAVKTIRAAGMGEDDSESREFRERFIREAQTAGILSHPNIVTIHDIGEDTETQTGFIAMEYIEGKNLKSLLAEKAPFPYDQIANMIAQVAEAIDYAHRKGIIHRDIKPANIIITTDEKVKITDFGIAKVASSNLTTTGQFLGTPNYMSPEQVSGAPVDGRSDIFSLGVVLYELLTKRKPFLGENLTAISYKIVHEDFTPPAELSSDVPPEFNPIVARAMAKDPWNRYQRGKDFALALHQLRAHLEEQKALADLGTIVSEAEFMPTLRLTNLDQLIEGELEGKPVTPPDDRDERSTAVLPTVEPIPRVAPTQTPSPFPTSDLAALSTESQEPEFEPAPRSSRVSGLDAPTLTGEPDGGRAFAPPEPPFSAPSDRRTPEWPQAVAPPLTPPRSAGRPPYVAPEQVAPPSPIFGLVEGLRKKIAWIRAQDWPVLAKREVNTTWFWAAAGGALVLVLLVVGPLFFRWRSIDAGGVISRDVVALKKETDDKVQTLEEAKKLFAAGQYEQSLVLLRSVIARSPGNQQARQYAQMAENALAGKQEETRKAAEADQVLQLAQAAFAEGNFEEAKKRADEVLALDGGRVEAQRLRDDAAAKIADVEAAAAKKKARTTAVAARRPSPVPETRSARVTPLPSPAPVANATGSAMIRLLFDSPVSEGHVMVAVNERILLRRPFSFKRKENLFKTVKGTGTVDASIPVQAGSSTLKVWLSGPDIPSSLLATANAQLGGGETRILRLEYSNGRLSARIQ